MAKKVKGLTISEAMDALQAGKLVRREAWLAHHRLELQKNFGIRAYKVSIQKDEKGKLVEKATELTSVYCQAKSFDGETNLTWSPSLKDLMADDWMVVAKGEKLKEVEASNKKAVAKVEAEKEAEEAVEELVEEVTEKKAKEEKKDPKKGK